MSLKTTQEGFVQQLVGLQPIDDFLEILQPCGNLHPKQQLAIYKNNVRAALQKCLAIVYPVCLKILGEKYFKQLARAYIADYPSKHYDLNHYGEYFSHFVSLQCLKRDELRHYLYLSDLVKLEWIHHQVYFASNSKGFDYGGFSKLTEQQQEKCVFKLEPSLKYIKSDYPILSIWKLNKKNVQTIHKIQARAETCCVYRRDHTIKLLTIESKTYRLLAFINSGATLKEIVQIDYDNDLPEIINQGWIDRYIINNV